MKFKWIELQNYAGIYNGMGINQIKIDFTKCKTNKIIIRGSNGSGKSTLMSAINVNPDSNDKFIPEAEARKNISILSNGVEYHIRYIHAINSNGDRLTTKGYIAKSINGVFSELNPNGNISSCKDIIYDEFNLDANFIALSQLGSEDRGLAYMRPSDRKKFVNSIINVLETYNNIYKTLNKKSSIFKSTINSLVYKIDSIGDETALQLNLKAVEDRISDLEASKQIVIEKIAGIKLLIDESNQTLQANNYDAVISELDTINKSIKILDADINRTLQSLNIEDFDKLSGFSDFVNENITKLETTIELQKQKIPLLLAERESEYKKLQDKNIKLSALQSEYNYLDIKSATETAKSKIAEYDDIFNRMGLLNINLITKEDFDTAMESIQYLMDLVSVVLANNTLEDINNVYNNRSNIKTDMTKLRSIRKSNEQYKSELSDLEKELSIYESKRSIADGLNDRPKKCNINTCPYIKSALEADTNYPYSKYLELLDKVNSLKDIINESDKQIEFIDRVSNIVVSFESIERELKTKIKFISKLPVKKDFAETFLIRMIHNDSFQDVLDLYKYIDCGNLIEEYKVAKENLYNYESEFKIYESKNIMIESIIKDIEELTTKTDALLNDIDTINSEIKSNTDNLDTFKLTKSKIEILLLKINDEYKPSLARQEELEKIKKSLENNVNLINSLHNDLNSLNTTLGSISNDTKNNSAERDKLKHSAELLKEYKSELEVYNTKYTKIEKIKYYSSPSTGIQTLFMELYMNKIIAIANNLLSLLFSGEFTLQPFIINESEFRIPCIGNGLMHDDISSMSTAQKCMISMILSFSLLYQSSTKYNIIKLDELDGALDTQNRNYFITLLDKLMDMLHCEQCFIVSHNNELDSYNSDLIVLKNELNENYTGNIIWKY